MSPKKRLNVLVADDGSEHARSAVKLLLELPLPSQSRITVLRVFNSGQIPLINQYQ